MRILRAHIFDFYSTRANVICAPSGPCQPSQCEAKSLLVNIRNENERRAQQQQQQQQKNLISLIINYEKAFDLKRTLLLRWIMSIRNC